MDQKYSKWFRRKVPPATLLLLSPNALQGLQAEKLPWRAPAGFIPWYWLGAQKVPAPSSQQFKPYAWASGFQVSSFTNLHWLWSSVFYIPEKYPSQQATVHVSLSYKNQTILPRKKQKGKGKTSHTHFNMLHTYWINLPYNNSCVLRSCC